MNDDLVQTALYVLVIAFGLQYVLAYVCRWTMYIPGETLKPGEKLFGRLFILFLGLVMVVWAGHALLK